VDQVSYHENPAINDTVLTVINDGNGEQCGYSYEMRKDAARESDGRGDIAKFRHMARNYGRYRKRYGTRNLTREEWVIAGDILLKYYVNHIREDGVK
jgi:hypothetical protein